jgi:3-deoxy-D-manno-octulosonate 8-phosphate phosphatase (KDO 8-P phosphatase)
VNLKKNILNKAKKIKLIATDIDGVLTNGKITILNSGEEIKEWSVYDGFACTLLNNFAKHIKIAWISGRKSRQVTKRAKEIGVHHIYQKCINKFSIISDIAKKENIKMENIAFIGDDLIDLPVLLKCGFSACPKNVSKELQTNVDYVTVATSGQGVFREVVEIILKSQGLWEKVLKQYKQ